MSKIMQSNGSTKRITLVLNEKSLDRLDFLVEATEASSRTEVLKNALRLFEVCVNGKKEGKDIFMKDEKGRISTLFPHY